MPGRVSSPVFIGRRAELARIHDAVNLATAGDGRLLLIAGEAGVGKTRLIQEAVKGTRAAGGLAAVGRCIELGGMANPFGPIRTALRDLGAASTESAAQMPNFDSGSASGDRVGVSADSGQARMFEACIDFLRSIGRAKPLLVVIEDIHWADPSTLDMLRFLAQAIDETPLVLAATFRSDELHRRHPLQPLLGEIQRLRTTERIDLARFSEEEVAQQLEAIIGQPGAPELVSRVHSRSDGNAFYAEELVAAGESGEPLPALMRDVLLARASALSDPAQALLKIVAAGGNRVATSIVADVARSEPIGLEISLREAVERHLLVTYDAEDGEHVSFRHALVQEAVYGELLPGERSRLHARYGEALASVQPNDGGLSGELAYHWFAAHDLPRSLTASIDAARWAEGHQGHADAQGHYERALELWDKVSDAEERTGLDRIELLERAAGAASVTSPPRAAALMLDALRTAEGKADPKRMGLLKNRYGRYAWMAGDGVSALAACREAIALVPAQPPTRERARVLAGLGQILMITLNPEEGKAICQQAVDTARALGDPEVECHALNSLGMTNVYLGQLDLGLGQLRESLDLATRIGSVDDAERAHGNLVDALSHSGLLAQAGEAATTAYDYAEQNGLVRVMGVIDLAEGGLALYRLGRWDQAYEMLQRATRHGAGGVPQIIIEERLAMLDVGTGRHESAENRIATARHLIERAVEAQLVAPLIEAAAELALWQGRPLDARAEIAAAFQRLPARAGYISRLGPLFALGARAEADVSQVARAQLDKEALEASATIANGYAQTMGRLHDEAVARLPNFVSQSAAWLAACQAEATRQNGRNDPVAWERCADAFGSVPMAYARAYALWRQSEAELAASRNRTSASAPLREALRIAEKLGAEPLMAEIRALAVRAGISVAAEDEIAAVQTATDSLGLTPREREILKLLATGRTNRQIAESLFITEGTAGTHVSNILGKLGVHARTEAASLAYKMGLVE
ncbi:MAG: AAA family ATPase [Chloroflexota bacterium]